MFSIKIQSQVSPVQNYIKEFFLLKQTCVYLVCTGYGQKLKHHGWSSRPSCPPQIQLQSKRTGAVLMRRMKDFQKTCFTKFAQNNIQYWNKCHGWSSRHSCPPQIQIQSKRTGEVLMKRMKDFQETCMTKLAYLHTVFK